MNTQQCTPTNTSTGGEQNQSDNENGLVVVDSHQPEQLPSHQQKMRFLLRAALGNVQKNDDEDPTTTNDANRYDDSFFDECCDDRCFLSLEELILVKAAMNNDEKTRKQKKSQRIIKFLLMIPLLLAIQFGLTLVAIRVLQPPPIISQEGGVIAMNQSSMTVITEDNNMMYDMYQEKDQQQQHSNNMNIDGIGIERNLNSDMGSMGNMGGDSSNGFCTGSGMVM